MASLECNYCGHGVHYHDEPNGTEYVFMPFSPWDQYAKTNTPIINFKSEETNKFILAWKCSECGCFHLFPGYEPVVLRAYIPTSLPYAPTIAKNYKYRLFDDVNFDAIADAELTPNDLDASNDYHYEFATVTDDFIHIFADKEFTHYLRSLKFFETLWSQSVVPYQNG